MKSTGEAMGIGRTFRAALLKAIRGLDLKRESLTGPLMEWSETELEAIVARPTHERLFAVCELLRRHAGNDPASDRQTHRGALGYRPFLALRAGGFRRHGNRRPQQRRCP